MSKNKKVQKLSDEEMQKNIEYFRSKGTYIKTALELLALSGAEVSEERKVLDKLGSIERFNILDVVEISKKEREFIIEYINGESSVTITYGFKSGDQWVKDIKTNYVEQNKKSRID